MNKKILLSASLIAAAAAIVVGGTIAYFTDTETSTGNTFTAGSIDLKIDSKATYNGEPVEAATWDQKDLDIQSDKFFNFQDLKPGDKGENTISLHVYDNDAWGRFTVANLSDDENDLVDPEVEAGDDTPGDENGKSGGELGQNLKFTVWLDQGSVPGFQNIGPDGQPFGETFDPEEGDNVMNGMEEPFWEGVLAEMGTWNISDVLKMYAPATSTEDYSPDGHNNYGPYQGIAADGRMVGSTTYYFGVAWELPLDTGNEVQSDSLTADMIFEVVQHRNNPNQNF